MMIREKNKIVFFSALFFLYIIAWMIQNTLFLNWDVSQLLASTKSLWLGGTYTHDFFTPNPPMILYLYTPPFLIFQMLHISVEIAFRFYFFLLSSISLFFAYQLSKRTFLNEDNLRYGFILVLAITYLIIPLYELGQRDCLLMVFTVPYSLMAVNRLEGHKINLFSAIAAGLLAGIGFAMKPQFLIILFFIEFYFCFTQKSFLSWMRTEVSTIVALLCVYIVTTYFFFPDYFLVIIPYLLKHYYNSVSQPFSKLIDHEIIWVCVSVVVIWVTQYKYFHYKTLTSLLSISVVAFLCLYFIQGSHFLYHIIPAFSLSILTLYVMYFDLLKQFFKNRPHHKTLVVIAILISCMGFSYPLYITKEIYRDGLFYKNVVLNPLIKFMHTQPPKQSLYAITIHGNLIAPLADYTGASIAERFDCLWMTLDYRKRFQKSQKDLKNYIRNNHNKMFFVNMIAEDFKYKKPDIVFVHDLVNIDYKTNKFTYFDFLNYFIENPAFKTEWKNYKYLTTFYFTKKDSEQSGLRIYKRIPL